MSLGYYDVDGVPVGDIFLSGDNPRHKPVSSEDEAIEYLCRREAVYPLARDIVRNGLNPLERFAVTPIKSSGKRGKKYTVAEGNRRLCALKLLADPDRAPPSLRNSFEKLAANWRGIKSVRCTVFTDDDVLRVWLDRVHSGPQGGVGRKTWDSEQKQRFTGDTKNKAAQALLDYAQKEHMISEDERDGKLTTVQRFLGNTVFREALGFDQSNIDDFARNRPKADFDLLLKRFVRDLIGKADVNSRMNSEEISAYARPLQQIPGVTTARIASESLSALGGKKGGGKGRKKPVKPQKAKKVEFDETISAALKSLGNFKLESLYFSICDIDLEHHTPIVAVGTWSFLETLTACMGRNENTSFSEFLSKNRLSQLGISDLRGLPPILQRIGEYGNTTKHHKVAGQFNGDQVNNDMVSLRDVILRCIAAASAQAAS